MTTSKNSGAAVSLKGVIGPAFYETHRLIRAGKIDEAVEKGGRASLKSSYVSVEVVLQLLRHPRLPRAGDAPGGRYHARQRVRPDLVGH